MSMNFLIELRDKKANQCVDVLASVTIIKTRQHLSHIIIICRVRNAM